MPIPDFDHNQVLPPHLGDPRKRNELSPFSVTSEEVCQHFSTSPERRIILEGWLDFRARLTAHGIVSGFQWLDGSFLEQVELSENRPPRDLDVVTYYRLPPGEDASHFLTRTTKNFMEFFDRDKSKQAFHLDHFGVHMDTTGSALVEQTRYWTGLFSHRRDGVWKGMLRVELATTGGDNRARDILTAPP